MLQIFTFHILFLLSGFVLESERNTDAKDFIVDELSNVYLIHDTYIERFNAVGNNSFRTSDLIFGNIDYFDITNPLKPFIHYRNNGQIVMFDNTLSQQGSPIDVYAMGFGQVELICGSRGDAYWLWDAANSELIRVDQSFQRLRSTGNLAVLLSKELHPMQLFERGDFLYIRDEKHGILVFDIYGTYRTTINIKTVSDIQVVDNEIIYEIDGSLNILRKDWLTEDHLELPSKNSKRVYFANQKLYLLQMDRLQIFGWRD